MEFIHDDTEVSTPKIKVVTKVSKWDKYEYIELNDKKYIHGYNTHSDSELFTFVEYSKPDILIALLELKTKLQTPESSNQSFLSDNLASSDIALIIQFCRRWGLAMWGMIPTVNFCVTENNTENIARNTMLRPVVPFAKENYLYIPSFIHGVNMLYRDFLKVVVYNAWQDDINIKPLLNGVSEKYLQDLAENFKRKVKNNITPIAMYTPNLMPFVTYWNDNEMCLQLNCENLLHVSVYYLCLWLQHSEFTGGYIRQCKKCGRLFISSQSRQQFCNAPCTRQAYYDMKKRNERNNQL